MFVYPFEVVADIVDAVAELFIALADLYCAHCALIVT